METFLLCSALLFGHIFFMALTVRLCEWLDPELEELKSKDGLRAICFFFWWVLLPSILGYLLVKQVYLGCEAFIAHPVLFVTFPFRWLRKQLQSNQPSNSTNSDRPYR